MEPDFSTESASETANHASKAGVHIASRRLWLSHSVELLSSMRFAISLLCMIAISSVIGTVLKQNEAFPNYVNKFGPFWSDVFQRLGLFSLYSAWWFLLIMAFLVLSTSLCVIRNAPKMLRDMRSWRDNVREQSLKNFHHRFEWHSQQSHDALADDLTNQLQASGYQCKQIAKERAVLIAAKRGAANKWGYIFAHLAIVVICVGGLLDSDLFIRMQMTWGGKQAFEGSGVLFSEIPDKHKLSISNPTYRGNILIPEGASGNVAVIPQSKGVLLQELPFTISLNHFKVDYYSTGMPKLFSSDVVIKDHETGKSFSAKVEVNRPLIHRGVAIFQSGIDDGGSQLRLKAHGLVGDRYSQFDLASKVGSSRLLSEGLSVGLSETTLELTGLRVINVENMSKSAETEAKAQDQQGATSLLSTLSAGLEKHSGAAAKTNADLKNVGPSFQFKLRDKTGQAREYDNYMMPVQLDGASVFLSGTRASPNEAFRYLRIPADDNDQVDEWMRLRAALMNETLREKAADAYARRALPATSPDTMQAQLAASARKGLEIFAGNGQDPKVAGFVAIAQFLESVPEAEQMKASEVFVKILNGSLWDLWQLARQQDGLPVLELNEKRAQFLQLAAAALSDAFFYGAPIYLQLSDFDEVKASVFQVSKAPGQAVVYIGCLFLVLGVFAMFYIRERRLWIWIKPSESGSEALLAFSSQRKTLDFEKEFEQLKRSVLKEDETASGAS